MRPAFFTVTVANSGLNTASPSDGFIDPKVIEQYMAGGSTPTTLAQTTAKRRGNKRWKFLMEKLGYRLNIAVDPASISTPGGSAIADPTSITFTLQAEAGIEALYTPDEIITGAVLTGAAAAKRMIARAMVVQQTKLLDVWDPTATEPVSVVNAGVNARRGYVVANVIVGRIANTLTDAEAAITVTTLYS